jgi:hypothetical protein
MLVHGAYLRPACTRAEVPQPVMVPVELYGDVTVHLLEGQLVIESPDAKVVALQTSQALTDAGFDILYSAGKNHTTFRLDSSGGARRLPVGQLFTATISLGPNTGVWYPVTIEALETEPPAAVCPGSNAIFAPPE